MHIFFFFFFLRTYIDNMYKKVEDFFTSLKNSQKKKLFNDNTRVLTYLCKYCEFRQGVN